MKRFIRYLITLVLLFVSVMFVLDTIYSYAFQHGVPRSKFQSILQLENQHFDYAFLGSSRTESHIDCEIITRITGKSCVNLGIHAGTIEDSYVLMKLLISNGVSIDNAFFQLDDNYSKKGLSANFKARLLTYTNNKTVRKELLKDPNNQIFRMVPFYKYLKNDHVIGFREVFNTLVGNTPKTSMKPEIRPLVGQSLTVHTEFPKKLPQSNAALTNLKQLFASQKSKLYFFAAPYCDRLKNRTTYFSSLKQEFPGLFDFTTLYDEQPSFYFDCGHLNFTGAKDYSEVFAFKLLSLGSKKK